MIGVIFHYGLYSVPAYDDMQSVARRRCKNGSEWFKARLEEESQFRPVAGHLSTKKHHLVNYGEKKYNDFINDFKCENLNFDDWMNTAKKMGATYVILTAKHHDSYCLFNTKTTDFNSYKSLGRDLVAEFIESAKKTGLEVGIYFSLIEFGKSITQQFIKEIMEPQLLELLNYDITYLWFDGHWGLKTKVVISKVAEICEKFKVKNPEIQINDRIGEANIGKHASYRVFSDRFIPDFKLQEPWESIQTIGESWGYNKMQTAEHYKSGKKLFEIYKEIKNKGGNLLLNFGPRADGTLDPLEVKSAEEFTKECEKI
jgi:alpha-L-fucosidase